MRGDRTTLTRDESGKLVKSVGKIGETAKLGLAIKKKNGTPIGLSQMATVLSITLMTRKCAN